jgi:hypothetical protein
MEPFRLTLPATLPAVLLANPGACVTPVFPGWVTLDRAVARHRRRDPYTVLRIALVLEPASGLRPSLLRIHSVACTRGMSPDTRRP